MKNAKRILFFLLLIITPALVLSGCGKSNGQVIQNTGQEARRPDFGQPEEAADIRGLVKSVVGNEVTVLKIERPQMDRAGEEDQEAAEEKAAAFGSTSGRMPGMGPGSRTGGKPDMDEDAEAQMLERMKQMATGEEKVIIPVGIQMLQPDTNSDNKEPSMVEATLADIESDQMLQIWLDDSITDRKVASFVLIMK